jgi:GNAT superfamily N-acetyltransferase
LSTLSAFRRASASVATLMLLALDPEEKGYMRLGAVQALGKIPGAATEEIVEGLEFLCEPGGSEIMAEAAADVLAQIHHDVPRLKRVLASHHSGMLPLGAFIPFAPFGVAGEWKFEANWFALPIVVIFGYFVYFVLSELNDYSRLYGRTPPGGYETTDARTPTVAIKTQAVLAGPDDLHAIGRLLWDGFSPRTWNLREWIKFVYFQFVAMIEIRHQIWRKDGDHSEGSVLLLKDEAGKPVGMVRFVLSPQRMALGFSDLVIHSAHRGQTLGERLVRELIQGVRDRWPLVSRVYFRARPESRTIRIARRLSQENG